MEKDVCTPLLSFMIQKSDELFINKQHRYDLDEVVNKSREIVRDVSSNTFFFNQS